MTTDRYTRGVLTVIAGALLYLCVLFSATPLTAQGTPAPFGIGQLSAAKPQPVVLVGWGSVASDGEIQITTVRDQSGRVRTDAHLPVALDPGQPVAVTLGVTPERPLPVGLTAVTPGADWEPIRTKVEPAPTQKLPGRGGGD